MADDSRTTAAIQGATPPDVAALLRSAGGGDEAAWRGIVDLYARRIYALARSRLGQGRAVRGLNGPDGRAGFGGVQGWGGCEIAEEVTQSVFVTVASKLRSGGYAEQGRFESWLFRVAMNRIRDEARRLKRRSDTLADDALADSAASPGVADRSDQTDAFAALRSAMSQLSEQDREVVELRHHASLSFRQISDLLEEPLGTLLARHHRALRKLKELLIAGGGAAALAGLHTEDQT